jgi:hypothetical protein
MTYNWQDLPVSMANAVQSVPAIGDLPPTGFDGELYYVVAAGSIYYWNSSTWAALTGSSGGGTDVTIGSPANGLAISGLAQVLTIGLSSASTTGALSSTDWGTFNGKQAAGNYVTALTGDITAAGPGSAAATLATVNSNVGSFAAATVTVNAKGLVTAASANTLGSIASQAASNVAITGGAITGIAATLNDQTGTTYSTQDSDNCKLVTFTNNSSIAVTLHKAAPVGFQMAAMQLGTGQVTFAAESGGSLVNRQSQTKTAGRYGTVSLFVTANSGGSAAVWVLAGDTAT